MQLILKTEVLFIYSFCLSKFYKTRQSQGPVEKFSLFLYVVSVFYLHAMTLCHLGDDHLLYHVSGPYKSLVCFISFQCIQNAVPLTLRAFL